jgi:hypothetical protein
LTGGRPAEKNAFFVSIDFTYSLHYNVKNIVWRNLMLYVLLGLNIVLIILILILILKKPAQMDTVKTLQELKDSFKSISFDTLKEQVTSVSTI